MAKDDYHVVVCRLLTILYGYFKTGERVDGSVLTAAAFGIPEGYFVNVIEALLQQGFVTGAEIIIIGGIESVKLTNLKITPAGIEYLSENSMMKKAVKFLKEAKSVIPGI